MSSTQNVKGNRKIVTASYTTDAVFKIPDGLDLEDKTVVESWQTKWGKLYINYVDSDEAVEIEPEWDPEMDFKYLSDENIEDADDYNIEYELRKTMCRSAVIAIILGLPKTLKLVKVASLSLTLVKVSRKEMWFVLCVILKVLSAINAKLGLRGTVKLMTMLSCFMIQIRLSTRSVTIANQNAKAIAIAMMDGTWNTESQILISITGNTVMKFYSRNLELRIGTNLISL